MLQNPQAMAAIDGALDAMIKREGLHNLSTRQLSDQLTRGNAFTGANLEKKLFQVVQEPEKKGPEQEKNEPEKNGQEIDLGSV